MHLKPNVSYTKLGGKYGFKRCCYRCWTWWKRSGASGNGIIEKDLTLLISKYMYDRLRELGIPTYITRTTDETIDSTERTNRIKNAFGTSKDVIVISNHINAGGANGKNVGKV